MTITSHHHNAVVKRRDEKNLSVGCGTKTRVILDSLTEYQRTRKAFVSLLTAPPADTRRCDPPSNLANRSTTDTASK